MRCIGGNCHRIEDSCLGSRFVDCSYLGTNCHGSICLRSGVVVALVVAALKVRVVALVSVALREERVVAALAENMVIVSNDSIERCKTNLKIVQ